MDGVALLSTTKYEDLAMGDAWGPFAEAVLPEDVEQLGDGVLALVTLRVLRRSLDGIPPGGVLTRQHFGIHGELRAGQDVMIDVRLNGQHHGRGGLSSTFTFALTQRGALVAVVTWTILEQS